MIEICFLLRGQKAFSFLSGFVSTQPLPAKLTVFIDEEVNVKSEYHKSIHELCLIHGIESYFYKFTKPDFNLYTTLVAVGWSYMVVSDRLYVIHDSILPRYRGFNPLVSALINAENKIGATFLKATDKVDAGPIHAQIVSEILYPIKIQAALEKMCQIYFKFGKELLPILFDRIRYPIREQDEAQVSFSMWRDEDDYRIDWHQSAEEIKRFVDSVGFPYLGASSLLNEAKVRILDSEVYPSLKIENRVPGKVFSLEGGCPVVACGTGLLKVTQLRSNTDLDLLPITKLKMRLI